MAVGDRLTNPTYSGPYAVYVATAENVQNGAHQAAMLVRFVDNATQYVDETGVVLTIKRAFANIAASASNSSIIAAVASKKLRVLALVMVAGGTATDITFQSNNTAISPLFANAANGGAVLPYSAPGYFETTAGQALKASTGAGSTTGVLVLYVEV